MDSTADINVLYVDDDPAFAEMVADVLERENDTFAVETATTANDGLDRLAGGDVACIISDYDMPGQNGIEFLEAVRAGHPDLPFVLFTGKGSEEVASDAISAGATDYLRKRSGTSQYKLLANRVGNAVERYRTAERATDLDRIRTLHRNVNRTLLRASSREEIETRVCEILTDAEPYQFAWIAEFDPNTERVVPRAAAGRGDGYLEQLTVTADDTPTGRGPGGTAIRERRVAVSQDITTDAAFEPWREQAAERGYRSVAAIPIEYESTLYGEFAVYAGRPNAFDEAEQELLADIGDDIARAFHAFDVRERLRSERDRRQALFENAPGPVVAYDIGEGGDSVHIADVNEAFTETFGYGRDAVVGEDPADVIIPDEEQARYRKTRPRALAGEAIIEEVTRTTATGTRTFLMQIIPYGAADTRPTGLYAWYTDISERRNREVAIENLHGTVQRLIEATTATEAAEITVEAVRDVLGMPINGIVLYDEEDHCLKSTAWTDKVEELADGMPTYHPGEGLAWEVFETGEPQLHADVSSVSGRYNPDTSIRSQLILPLGEHGTLLISSTETDAFDDTDVRLARTLAANVTTVLTRIKREQDRKRQNDRLERFASVASHDLRNPLTVASGRLELARETVDSEHLDSAAAAVDRSLDLLDDLLTLAREGDRVDDIQAVDLAAVLGDCWQNVDGAEAATLVSATGQRVRADESRLRQLLVNLFQNAVDHGGERVTVTVGALPDGFYVEDDGPGIAESDRDRVFEIGYSTSDGGTGFGLNIVQEIVDAHGWDVRIVESETGGARFEITGVDVV